MDRLNIDKRQLAYVGDDLNDLAPMDLAVWVGCPNDACEEIKEIADYVSHELGGHGAVRDIVKKLLQERQQWDQAIATVYGIGC